MYKGDDEFVGGKIGKSTSAKETYAGVFEIPIGNEVRPIAIVVLGSEDIKKDIDSLRALIQEKYGAE